MNNEPKKPEFVTDEHLEYLEHLRQSGATNMFGATPYLVSRFPELTQHQARQVLTYWMKTYKK